LEGEGLSLSINGEIRSPITCSALLQRPDPHAVERSILEQLDLASLGHNTFTAKALALIETVRDVTLSVDLKQVNRVLLSQPMHLA
jgi:hypothetical protein